MIQYSLNKKLKLSQSKHFNLANLKKHLFYSLSKDCVSNQINIDDNCRKQIKKILTFKETLSTPFEPSFLILNS